MKRKGGCTDAALVLAAIIIGLASIGMQVYAPTPLVNAAQNYVGETQATMKAEELQNHLEDHYLESAMNLSVYQSAYEFGGGELPPGKRGLDDWNESSIPSEDEYNSALEEKMERDFEADYFPGVDVPESCELVNPAPGSDETPVRFSIDDRYANKSSEVGFNFSSKPKDPLKVKCKSDTSSTTIGMSDEIENRFHHIRLFHMYNLTQNLTSNKRFRFLVEGAAMNVSKYLRLRSDPENQNCNPDGGDGTNAVGSEPYNDGPDCRPNKKEFKPGTEAFNKTVHAAEEKYENRVNRTVRSNLNDIADKFQNNPEKWLPSTVDASRLGGDLKVKINISDFEYHLYNIRRNYTDRKVVGCTQSAADTFYVSDVSASGSTSGTSCSCNWPSNWESNCASGCGTICNGNLDCTNRGGYDCKKGGCNNKCVDTDGDGDACDTSVSVKDTCSNVDCGSNSDIKSEVNQDLSCSCPSSYSNCDVPSWFPTWTDPSASVNDSKAESIDGDVSGLPTSPTDYPSRDCIGEKTSSGYSSDSCELDNACNIAPLGYRADTRNSRPGDAKDYADEVGAFRICSNTEDLYTGTDNPWTINISNDSSDNFEGNWNNYRFEQRYFEDDYSLGTGRTTNVAFRRSTVNKMNLVRRSAACGSSYSCMNTSTTACTDTGSSCSGGPDMMCCCTETCTAKKSKCRVGESCKYDFDATCTVDLGENSYTDKAYENEIVQTTGNYRFNLKAYVRLKITVTDTRYRIPTRNGLKHPRLVVYYDQYAVSTFDRSSIDSVSYCNPSPPYDPDG